ncbi:hypothetical protein CP533_6265 [Ophiocordyceps camponoti-saundersi (nom. inval.)]|nr:hypothetical protein CP533_6265 [Ophiocordyceps camponoti-saundersi (nom. inval.)]
MYTTIAIAITITLSYLLTIATAHEFDGACIFRNHRCKWRGRLLGSFCTRSLAIRIDRDPYPQRVATTQYLKKSDICREKSDGVNPGPDCCRAYGKNCMVGYQELWCEKFPVRARTVWGVPHNRDTCAYQDRVCQWYGSSLSCGGSEFSQMEWNRYHDYQRQLVLSTEYASISTICKRKGLANPGKECCKMYGTGCLLGYKRLWCY